MTENFKKLQKDLRVTMQTDNQIERAQEIKRILKAFAIKPETSLEDLRLLNALKDKV